MVYTTQDLCLFSTVFASIFFKQSWGFWFVLFSFFVLFFGSVTVMHQWLTPNYFHFVPSIFSYEKHFLLGKKEKSNTVALNLPVSAWWLLVFSNTNRVPWGKQPVPSWSLGMERWLSSERYFYLDNSSSMMAGQSADLYQCYSPTAQPGQGIFKTLNLENMLLPLVTCQRCPTRLAASHRHPEQCHMHLWNGICSLAVTPLSYSCVGAHFLTWISSRWDMFWLCTAPISGGQRKGRCPRW